MTITDGGHTSVRPTPTTRPRTNAPAPPSKARMLLKQPSVIVGLALTAGSGVLALIGWLGALWAGVAVGGVVLVSGAAFVGARRRRNKRVRTGGPFGGRFPGRGRRTAGPRPGRPRLLGGGGKGGSGGLFGRGRGSAARRPGGATTSGRPGGLGRRGALLRRNPATGKLGLANPFKRGPAKTAGGASTGRRGGGGGSSASGRGRSLNPFRRSGGAKAAGGRRSAGSSGGRSRSLNPFRRTGRSGGPAGGRGAGAPKGPGASGRRSLNPFRRRTTGGGLAGGRSRPGGASRPGTPGGRGVTTGGRGSLRKWWKDRQQRRTTSAKPRTPTAKGRAGRTGTPAAPPALTPVPRRSPRRWLADRRAARRATAPAAAAPTPSRPAAVPPASRAPNVPASTSQPTRPAASPAPATRPAAVTQRPQPARTPGHAVCPTHGPGCTRNHNDRSLHQHDHPREGGPVTGSQSLQGSAAMEDAGLITFLKNTAPAGEHLREKARKFRALAAEAENQPLDPSVVEDLNTMATVYEKAATTGDALWPDALRGNAGDFGRGEEPRKGSTGVEARADVGQTVRDGYA